MEWWAKLLAEAPYIAIILALAAVVVFLFKSRDKLQSKITELQAKHTDDLVRATSALQDLTAEYLKQSFADSAGWQDRYKSFEATFKQHSEDDKSADARIEAKLSELDGRVKDYIERAVKDVLHGVNK